MSSVIIIGGGAAGLMAAYSASLNGHQVTIIEQNEKLGKKIYITGKGRCNFTNACDTEDLFRQIITNDKFMYSAIYTFSNYSVMDFFESNGMLYKIERGNRCFPESDKASDVTNTIARAIRQNGVKILLNTKVKDVLYDFDTSKGKKKAIGVKLDDNKTLHADAIIVATGGFSYQTTGSRGDGYNFAKAAGMKITKINPALVPFECLEPYITQMQGLSLKNVNLAIYNQNNKLIYNEFGEMLFTHFGISGPLVLTASSMIGSVLRAEQSLRAEIDLKPALDEKKLESRIMRIIDENKNKQFKSFFNGFLPSKMISVCVKLLNIPEDKKLNEITSQDRANIIKLLKHFPLTISKTRGFNEAIITQGGVSVKDINPSTMESKSVDGLYFAGEVIDVDALTGGFNLQIAFSTGYLAGLSIE